jgi:hypothetical protein
MLEMKRVDRVGQRRVCSICRGLIDKSEAAAEFKVPGNECQFLICGRRIKGGRARVDAHLVRQAEQLEATAPTAAEQLRAQAREVRALVGQLKLPDYESWKADDKRYWDEWLVMQCAPDKKGLAEQAAARARLAATESGRKFLADLDASPDPRRMRPRSMKERLT